MTVGIIGGSAARVAPILHTLEEIDAEIALRRSVWRPQDGPQRDALESPADILGYGGAAGGGKSDLIIGASLTRHRRSIIFRREAVEVRDLHRRAGEIVADVPGAKVNHGLTSVYLPNGDRLLEFGGIQHPDDWRKHRGRARDGYFFDEASEFEELMIRSLIGWNRTTIPGQRTRVILTFNPPTAKRGQWLVSFFGPWLDPRHPNPADYGELRWFTTVNGRDIEVEGPAEVEIRDGQLLEAPCTPRRLDREGKCASCGGEVVRPLSRTFVKALLSDNAFLADTNYRATLMGLPEPLRSQLLYGSFEAEEADDPDQCIPTRWVQLAQERWIDTPTPTAPLSAIGADPARGGADRTAFAVRIGVWFDYPVCYPGVETPRGRDVIAKLAEVASRYKITTPKIVVGMDVVGVGSSPADAAEETNIQLIPLSGGEAADEWATDATGMLHFKNRRAQWYWQLREALDPEKGENLALPPDRELLADLCAPKYAIGPRGIELEKKEDIKKRLGRSPDKGDAVVYAYAARPLAVGYQTTQQRSTAASIASPGMPSSWKSKRGL